jgi:hypothetical protein
MTTPNIPPPSSEGDLSRWILQFENAQNIPAMKPRLQWADQAIIELKDSAVGSEISEQGEAFTTP